jgi:hypothetical protein
MVAWTLVYKGIENSLSRLGSLRDQVAGQMRAVLLGAAFSGQPVHAGQVAALIAADERVLAQAQALA